MTVRLYCDACGQHLERNSSESEFTSERTFRNPDGGRRVLVIARVVAYVDAYDKAGELCRACVIDTVNAADTRPKATT